jgi:hypothetical protein
LRVTIIGYMALTALVIGTAAGVLGTGRVTIPLVLSTTWVWSWVPVVQLMTGLLVAGGRGATRRVALARYFATGRYWSTWILCIAVILLLLPDPQLWMWRDYLLLTFLLPATLTARSLRRMRRELFGDSPAAARWRVAAHQLITYSIVVLYIAWAVALWPRLATAGP